MNNIEDSNKELENQFKELQERFVESDKFASIGKMTAGILHEIKNPLNFVNNFAKLSFDLLEELNELLDEANENVSDEIRGEIKDVSEMLDGNVKKILENGERAQRIILTMLTQARENQETVFESTDFNQLVDEFVKLAYQGIRGNDKEFNVSIRTNYDDSIGKISIGIQEMSRVIINLVNNACYALDKKKKEIGDDFIPTLVISTLLLGKEIELKIRDNGTGIPQKVVDKLFQPFFTTKPKGQGTGLGLSLTHEIITKTHKGKIEISTEENEFTEFVIRIPITL